MFDRCLTDVWAMFGRFLADVWPMFGRCLACVWPMFGPFGRCLADVWAVFGRCLTENAKQKCSKKIMDHGHGLVTGQKKGRKARTMSPACLVAVAMAASSYLLSLRYPLRYSSLNANWLLAWGRPKFFVCFITLL